MVTPFRSPNLRQSPHPEETPAAIGWKTGLTTTRSFSFLALRPTQSGHPGGIAANIWTSLQYLVQNKTNRKSTCIPKIQEENRKTSCWWSIEKAIPLPFGVGKGMLEWSWVLLRSQEYWLITSMINGISWDVNTCKHYHLYSYLVFMPQCRSEDCGSPVSHLDHIPKPKAVPSTNLSNAHLQPRPETGAWPPHHDEWRHPSGYMKSLWMDWWPSPTLENNTWHLFWP